MVCLALYASTMFIIEAIGKHAVRNAANNISRNLLHAKLSEITTQDYEHDIMSIVHHSENVSATIRNLFIEFPKKNSGVVPFSHCTP